MDFYAESNSNVKKERAQARRMRKTQWWLTLANRGVCHYCNTKVGKENITMDHVVPLSRGGKSTKGNIVPSCKECNNQKKSGTPVDSILD